MALPSLCKDTRNRQVNEAGYNVVGKMHNCNAGEMAVYGSTDECIVVQKIAQSLNVNQDEQGKCESQLEALRSELAVPRISRKWYHIPDVLHAGCKLDQSLKP